MTSESSADDPENTVKGSYQMVRRLVCFFLVLAGSIHSYTVQAAPKSDYEIINTGIKGGGCWYDDNHFIVVQGHQPAPGQGFEVEGLYYINPHKPKELVRIDLSPIDTNQQKHIRDVTCQEQTILFHVLTTDKKRNTLYSLRIGQPPAILAEKTEGFVVPQLLNIRNQYVLSFSPALGGREVQYAPSPEQARKDCQFSFVQDGYRVHCLRPDRGTKQMWLVSSGFLVKYIWDETVRVNKSGQYQWVPNPEPPLKLPDGIELKQGYLLRDLENRIVQEVPLKQGIYRIDAIRLKPNPGGNYLYATCSKAGDYDPPKTFFGRVCRFKLVGIGGRWEEVFSVQKRSNERASLYDLDVNDAGDVVVLRRENRVSPTLWKYTARRGTVEQVPTPQLSQEIGAAQLSPDGQMISYVDRGLLVFVLAQGVKP